MITFKNLYKSYKDKPVLIDVNLEVETGEFMVLIGSSGCGKTTLLKSINKLHNYDKGDILIDGVSVKNTDGTELRRRIGYVVQDAGLFPHMTVEENLKTVLKINNIPEKDWDERIDELLRMVELEPSSYRKLYPVQLSGGQKQRVGVARAFAADHGIILMDEPFSALDPVTRTDLQDYIVKLQKRLNKTIIFVTHDMDEAIKMATRICIIQNGRIVQCDKPENILKHPANDYVRQFIGKNRLWNKPEFIKARDIMQKNPCRISSERTLIQAMQIMTHNAVDSVLVTEDKKLAGIIWLKDLQNFKDYTDYSIKDFLSDDFVAVNENTNLKEIMNTVDYKRAGIIPVVNDDNVLTGFLSKSRLLLTLSKQYQQERVDDDGGLLL